LPYTQLACISLAECILCQRKTSQNPLLQVI